MQNQYLQQNMPLSNMALQAEKPESEGVFNQVFAKGDITEDDLGESTDVSVRGGLKAQGLVEQGFASQLSTTGQRWLIFLRTE